jgi:phage I-like protein
MRFASEATGRTAEEAFAAAVEEARYMHGHRGYTGTIAEKSEFAVVKVPPGIDAENFIAAILGDETDDEAMKDCVAELSRAREIADDKWGPAACVQTGEDTFVFFGWASC